MSLFARNLRFLRKQRGLNQDDISLLFNKRANTVGNWENSKSEPSIGELVKLADYFKVGLQELLHADLQKKSLQAIDAVSGSPDSVTAALNTYPVNDAGSSLAQDGSSDSFWLILRELRSMNEKLDVLKLFFESGSRIPDSDKSNH
ncbi:MAG: helix-turn-helix transcriptional regulator [Bacteroidota bacterium]|nr:helix-turn-helix transcriptional regulator [Bacteroidota bacterium]